MADSLERLLAQATDKIERLPPVEAHRAARGGALVVDIRSDDSRRRDGVVPGSLHVPRTVLEWRFAADSEWRDPAVADGDRRLILLCDHGFSSVLAAATLVDLGFTRVGDVMGGFEAWRDAGLPVAHLH